MKYDVYIMLIENPKTGEKKTYKSPRQGSAPAGWICKGVLGGYEKPKEERK
jgi:hypothetical protein